MELNSTGRMLSVSMTGGTLTRALIADLHRALDAAEAEGLRTLVIEGADPALFCDGMDFAEALSSPENAASAPQAIRPFFDLLARFTASPVVVVALVEGRVNAGGMGLVAAADMVVAGPDATFGLSEVLFGLVPAVVAPFLVRRIGWQATYRLSLTAERIAAPRAAAVGLVDELADNPRDALRRLAIRLDRTRPDGVAALKGYFGALHAIDDETGRRAVELIARLVSDPQTLAGIRDFMEGSGVPWRT
jgi:polyketide biosynthesis enoyl-CoA hydratase PksH